MESWDSLKFDLIDYKLEIFCVLIYNLTRILLIYNLTRILFIDNVVLVERYNESLFCFSFYFESTKI